MLNEASPESDRPSFVPSSSRMDEIRLFTATRAIAARIAIAGAMAAVVNDDHNHVVVAIMEAQNIYVQYSTYGCMG